MNAHHIKIWGILIFSMLIQLKGFSQCHVISDFNYSIQNCTPGNQYHVVFSNLSTDIGGQIASYDWNFGDGSPISHANNPAHNYNPGNIYNATLITFDTSGCSDTITIPINIPSLPLAQFSLSNNNVCSGNSIDFTFTGSGMGLNYLWNFGDGQTSTLLNPSHSYNSVGCGTQNYTATLVVTDANGCHSLPYGMVITIKQAPDVLYYEPNGYTFCHSDTSNVSDTAKIFNFSPSACINNFSVNWGDGSLIETSPPLPFDASNSLNHVFDQVGYYNMVIVASGSNGCQTTFNQSVIIESNPVAAIIGPPVGSNVGCAPLNICFTNISQNITPTTVMTVDWGDGNIEIIPHSSVGNLVCHTYTQSGCHNGAMTNYSITLTAQNSCDFSTTTWSPVRIYEPPQSNFIVVDDSVCINEPAIFRNITIPNTCAANTGTFYTWDFGDGNTYGPIYVPSGANPQQIVSHPYSTSGTYTVTLTANNSSTNGCGSSTFTSTVFVSDAQASFSFDTVCFKDPTHFIDASLGYGGASVIAWQWNFGDGHTSTLQNPNNIYTNWGDFNARLIITTDFGCTDTLIKIIHVDTLPYVQFSFDTVCIGESTHFINQSIGRGSPIISYQWNFGDGNTSSDPNPTHIFSNPGSYSVLLIAQAANGCIDSIRKTVNVSPPPIASFTNTTACIGNPTQFLNSSTSLFGTITQWEWDFGDGVGFSNLQNPSYQYSNSGTFNVQLIITTNIGCKDTIIRPVFVSPLPSASFSAIDVCQGQNTVFIDLSSGNGTIISQWNWNFGDGNTSTIQNPTHTYANAGSFNATLTISNIFGCQDDTSITINIDSLPEAQFIASTECLGTSSIFSDQSIAHGSPIVSWYWDFGDGQSSSLQNPSHLYGSAGTYNVLLVVENAKGCIDSIRYNCLVSPQPIANFSSTTACLGTNTIFTNTSSTTNGTIISWEWTFGDGIGTSNIANPLYQYPDSGWYSVCLIVSTDIGCKDTITQSVYVSPLPKAQFIAPDVCYLNTTHFNDLSLSFGTNITLWNYQFGDGNNSNNANPTHLYNNPGQYNVWLEVSNQFGCTDDTTIIVVVDSLPEPEFVFSNTCLNDTNHFQDNSLAHGSVNQFYTWDFGDGQNGTGTMTDHLYSASGLYNVTLTVSNANNCSASITHGVTVFDLPEAGFANTPACFGSAISFNDTSHANSASIIQWEWDFGDGIGTSTQQNPFYNYTATGNYQITLIIQNSNGCKDTLQSPLQYMPTPLAEFSFDTVCAGDNTTFSNLTNSNGSTISAYQWNFGDGNFSTSINPSHAYSTGGQYWTTLIVNSISGCSDTIQHLVSADTIPSVAFATNSECLNNASQFVDLSTAGQGSIINWEYQFGDGQTSVGVANPIHTYSASGSYTAILRITNSYGCQNTDSISVTIHSLPQALFNHGNTCVSNNVHFNDHSIAGSATINQWDWNFGDGIGTSSLQNPDYTYANIDTLMVSLMIEDMNGCRDTITDSVRIWPNPIVNFSADTICFGETTTFTDLSNDLGFPISQWDWQFGDGNTSHIQNPTNNYPNAGLFNVELIATNSSGCKDSISQLVKVFFKPNSQFLVSSACLHDSTTYTDLSVAGEGIITSWQYNFGDGNFSSNSNASHLFSTDGSFTSELIVQNSVGCLDTSTNIAIVHTLPLAGFNYNLACIGASVNFTDTTIVGSGIVNSWNWNFGEPGGTSSLQNPAYIFSNSNNTQSVTLIVHDINGCSDTIQQSVVLYQQPTAYFTANNACSGNLTQFIDSSYSSSGGIIQQWNWNFGDGNNSTLENPGHYYNDVSVTTLINVSLIAFDDHGCSDTIISPVIIYPLPTANFNGSSACNTHANIFADLSNSNGGAITHWNWNFGDGSPLDNSANPNHIYPPIANTTSFTVNLSVIDVNGCQNDTNKTVQVYPLPVVGFEHQPVCQGTPYYFIDTSYSNGATLQTWDWNFGDGSSLSGITNPTHQYIYQNNADTFNVTLIVTDQNNCTDSTTIQTYLWGQPNANFNAISACSGLPSSFLDLSIGNPSSISQWQWDFGDGVGNSLIQNPSYNYPGTTTVSNYTVELMVEDINGCRDTITQTTTIYPSPIAQFQSDSVCSGDAANYSDLSTTISGTLQSWLWDFGDGSNSTLSNPSHTFPQALNNTPYSVTLVVENSHGCKDTAVKNTIIYPNPVLNFSTNIACFGNPSNFSNTSFSNGGSIILWEWNFGDGNTSSQMNPSHIYGSSGLFSSSLIATDINGCSSNHQQSVFVDSLPIPQFSYSQSCTNGLVSFINTSSGNGSNITSYWWNFGDQSFSMQTNPLHYFSPFGQYPISLIVSNDRGCRDSISQILNVSPGIEWDFNANMVCLHQATDFNSYAINSQVPAIAWNWSFGDGTFSTEEDPQHVYTVAGTYNVLLTVHDASGCDDIITHQITVNPLPQAAFSSTIVQIPNSTQFTDESSTPLGTIVEWHWDFDDGQTSTIQNPQHSYANPGFYQVQLIVKNIFGCLDTVVQSVQVNGYTIAEFHADTVCAGTPMHFTESSYSAIGNVVSWYWDFGDGYSSTNQHPTHIYFNSGVFVVTLTATNESGISGNISHSVLVKEAPTADFTASSICLGNSTSFFDESTFNQYPITAWNWNLNDGQLEYQPSFIHEYTAAGQYQVQLIATNSIGCKDTITKLVNVWDLPQISITAIPQQGCIPLSVQFTDQTVVSDGSAISWLWNFGDGGSSVSSGAASHEYTSVGIYDLQVSVVSNHGCQSSQLFPNYIQSFPNPISDFYVSPENPSYSSPTVFLQNASIGASIWYWDFGDENYSLNENPSHEYGNAGEYIITLISSNIHGCSDTSSHPISYKMDGLEYFPNAMTPNGDGINDYFIPFAQGWQSDHYNFYVYNRWGELLFHTTDINQPWNGKNWKSNQAVETGVYVWKVIVNDINGKEQKFIGHISVYY